MTFFCTLPIILKKRKEKAPYWVPFPQIDMYREFSGFLFNLCRFLGFPVIIQVFCNVGQSPQTKYVRDYHQAVEQVGEVPNQVNLQHGTNDDEYNDDRCIDLRGYCRMMFEQVSNVLLTEEVPTDDGGEGEEEHADCDEDCAEVTVYALKSSLGQLSSGQRLVVFLQLAGAQYGESSQVQNDQSIDEYRADRNQTLVARMVNLCYRMRMWGRTHTSFVGEQAAGNAKLDRGGYRNAGEAAQSSARIFQFSIPAR